MECKRESMDDTDHIEYKYHMANNHLVMNNALYDAGAADLDISSTIYQLHHPS